MKISIWLLRVLVTYLATWLLSYFFYVGSDVRFIVEYWLLFWKGGGELPTFIQLTSWSFTLVIIGGWLTWAFATRSANSKNCTSDEQQGKDNGSL